MRQRARHIEQVLRAEGCEAILACSGDLLDIPAAIRAARNLPIPCYLYLFDDYVYPWTLPFRRAFAQRMAEDFAAHAAGVIVPNEFLARSWRSRFAGNPVLIRNVVDQVDGTVEDLSPRSPWGRGVEGERASVCKGRIVYTGSVYTAQVDAFRNLLAALNELLSPDCTLHVYSSSTPAVLGPIGSQGQICWHGLVSAQEALALQRSADILFLPLAFASPYPELVNTSAPGKMGELLASGRPILVHAPAASFVSWYFRTHDCGIVVDRPEPRLLADALRRLRTDPALGQRLVRNARARARLDFNPATARDQLIQLVQRAQAA